MALAEAAQTLKKGTRVLVSVGLSQKSAAVADRAVLATAADDLESTLAGYAALGGIDEVAVLSTCYRVEILAATRCPAAATLALQQAVMARAGRELPLTVRHGLEALRHLVRVAASLESEILGEPQILGQVKDAFQRALDAGFAGSELAGVLGRVLHVAKRVRTETHVGRSGISWGHAAAALAGKILGSLSGRRVVIVGAGEMARATARYLHGQRALITILNRTLEHAAPLAAEVGGDARPLEALDEELLRADVVVSAAPAALAALEPTAMAHVMKVRRRRIVLVDLAVPRAIPAETGALPDVYLCDVDDLGSVMSASTQQRQSAVAQADRIVEEELSRIARADTERRAAPIIAELRTRAATIAREEVERTLSRLGEDPELARRLDAMAGSIVAKILHQPSARLKEAVCDCSGEGEAILEAAVQIFGLETAGEPRRGKIA
jgi:glutamyl-tRNA reductase